MTWFDPAMTGTLIGFGSGRASSSGGFHVLEYTLNGPGAARRRSLCGGTTPVITIRGHIDDLDDVEACWAMLTSGDVLADTIADGWDRITETLGETGFWDREAFCRRCLERYEARAVREADAFAAARANLDRPVPNWFTAA